MGGGRRHEQLALGETPNVAARVQGKAEPDEVVISAATQRLVAGLFETEDRGRHELKGISAPQPLYRVMVESTAHNRFEVAVQRGLTPLVGRETEVEFLHQRWEQAQAGAGQAVLLSGEAGMGKSRLVQELKAHSAHEGATYIAFQCSPYRHNSAWYPVIAQVERLLQFAADDTPQTKLDKLQHMLGRYRFSQANTVSLLAALLSLPQPADTSPLTESPQKQKGLIQHTLVQWLVEEAEETPVVCVWEDLHWADPSTLELLTLCLEQIPTARMLALLVFRPEFTPPWGTRSYLSQLALSRLDRSHVEGMVERVTGGRVLPIEVVEQVATKTDGVPLFIEELTKSIVESDLVRAVNSHYELTGPLSDFAIPSTLHDSLMARLDRLSTAKEIAQLGATIGREFSYELLRAVSSQEEKSLQLSLQQLVDAELVYQRGVLPQAHFLFKHALIQDTAYQSLLRSTRQHYHQQIAEVLEKEFPETVETQPELLAQHFTEARNPPQAIPYWQQAGQRAVQRSAHAEAVAHFTKGLELLRTQPDTSERVQQELMLQLALGPPLISIKGQGTPEVESVYSRALELCRQIGETPELFPTLFGLRALYLVRGELRTARELGERCLTLAQLIQDPARLVVAHQALAAVLFFLGELALAQAHHVEAITLYDPQQHNPHALGTPYDPGVVSLSYTARILWLSGYPDQALKRIQEALSLARKLAHPFSLAFALGVAVLIHQYRREGRATQEYTEAVITLSREQEFAFWGAAATFCQGWALAEQGHGEKGLAQMRKGLVALRDQAAGGEMETPAVYAQLAEGYRHVDQIGDGLSVLAEALVVMGRTGSCFYEADLYRLQGELTLQQVNIQDSKLKVQEEAEAFFQKALDIARQQGAKSWELRAATSLARLWRQQGKTTEAYQFLAEIYQWFTEGFDTKDLQEAKALLEELS